MRRIIIALRNPAVIPPLPLQPTTHPNLLAHSKRGLTSPPTMSTIKVTNINVGVSERDTRDFFSFVRSLDAAQEG